MKHITRPTVRFNEPARTILQQNLFKMKSSNTNMELKCADKCVARYIYIHFNSIPSGHLLFPAWIFTY